MEIKIVTRHQGTVTWLNAKGIMGEVIPQLTPEQIVAGDILYGVLPIPLIALAFEKGARVILTVLPAVVFAQRGSELTPAEMDGVGARLLEVVSLQLKEVQ